MKNVLVIIALCFIVYGCKEANSSNTTVTTYGAQETINGTLKDLYAHELTNEQNPVFSAKWQYLKDNKDDVLNSFTVVETVEIPRRDLTLAFIQFSVGADIARTTAYMRKLNGKWYIDNNYFSNYDDDPFNNGEPEKGKALLEKKDKWEDPKAQPWWL
jgi:hypothetical protein